MSHSNGIILVPVDIKGDIAYTLGSSSGDLGTLCKDTGNKINPLALWKPFRNSARNFASASDQLAAIRAQLGGFRDANTGLPTYMPQSTTGASIPSAPWTYYKPRGVSDNEPFRATDFAPLTTLDGQPVGYYHGAVSPIGVLWPAKLSDNNYVVILKDGDLTGSGWRQNLCLSIADVLPSNSTYYDYHFALILSSTAGKDLIVSQETPRTFASGHYPTMTFEKSYCNALASLSVGSQCAAAVCLYNTSDTISGSSIYHIGTLPGQINPTVVSLEIASGCDRKIFTVGNGTIANMTIDNLSLTVQRQSSSTITGAYMYKVTAASFRLTPGSGWEDITHITCKVTFTVPQGMIGRDGQIYGGEVSYQFTQALSASDGAKTLSFSYGGTMGGESFNVTPFKPTTAGNLSVVMSVEVTYDTIKTASTSATLGN